jgi:hypothetical protein
MEVIMKKTHSFLLTAGIMLATTFTLFACSDDKDDPITYTYGTGSCYTADFKPGVNVCLKLKMDATQAYCDQFMPGTTYREADCESSPALSCEKDEAGQYWYGTLPDGTTCENIKEKMK